MNKEKLTEILTKNFPEAWITQINKAVEEIMKEIDD